MHAGLNYALAVTCFEMRDFRQTAKLLNEIISKALASDPALAPPFQSSTDTSRIFKNSPALQDSCLIEAYNLKAAMEYHTMNCTYVIILPRISFLFGTRRKRFS